MTSEKKKSKAKRTLQEVKTLGQQLLSSRTNINNLPLLLTFVSPNFPPQYVLESLLSLQSFFTTLLPSLPSSFKSTKTTSEEDDAELIYRTWLRSKFDDLVRSLIDLLLSEQVDEALRQLVLDSLMEFVKVGNGGRFHSAIYHRLLHNILHSSTPVDLVLDSLASKYFKYIDIRYFTYISLAKLAKTLDSKDNPDDKTKSADRDESHSRASIDLCIHRIHYIISQIPPLVDAKENSDYEMWSGPEFSSKKSESETQNKDNGLSAANISKKMKLKFTKAWISFLRLPLPVDVYKEVLISLHQAVIPYISNPVMLCDFLTRSYDIGGVVSVMALSSLFILMTQHGLEYPNFYEKLYALLLPSVFMAKHRAKFFEAGFTDVDVEEIVMECFGSSNHKFITIRTNGLRYAFSSLEVCRCHKLRRLLDTCLKSPLLPAYLAAAFAKKLSRLSLSVPPSGSVVIIALIHNLLRRHPSINCLVHREDCNGSATDNSDVKGENAGNANDSRTGSGVSAKYLGVDHFNNEESNPVKTNALRSSLWEIDTLRHHYCPPVSRFVPSLEIDSSARNRTTELNIKDFSSSSYGTIFGEELRRRVKQVPLAFYKATPTFLFSESDFTGWTFNYEESMGNKSEENGCSPAKRQRVSCS